MLHGMASALVNLLLVRLCVCSDSIKKMSCLIITTVWDCHCLLITNNEIQNLSCDFFVDEQKQEIIIFDHEGVKIANKI